MEELSDKQIKMQDACVGMGAGMLVAFVMSKSSGEYAPFIIVGTALIMILGSKTIAQITVK